MLKTKNSQRGFSALLITILVLVIIFGIAISITGLTLSEYKILKNITKSSQAYYAAEAGIEDSVYRIIKGKNYEATNSFRVGEGEVTISITDEGSKKILKSTGEISQRIKVLEAVLSTETSTITFHYGAQVDKGGLTIGANASVSGNVYSNGSIIGQGKGSGSKITGDVWVAGAVASTPDQQWTEQNFIFVFGIKIGSVDILDTAQSFIPTEYKILNMVSLYLAKVGSPPDQTVRILTDAGGRPSTTSLASGTLKSSKVTSNLSWVDVSFDPPPLLTAEQTYWIMIDVSRDNKNYWIWGKDSSDGYVFGTGKYTRDWDSPAAVWNSVGGDLNFKTWMGGEIPTYINRVWVGMDAHANTITDSWIDSEAYYQTIDGGTRVGPLGETCPNSYCHPNSPDPATKDLPISYAQIQDWEKAACCDTGTGCKAECIQLGNLSPAAGSSLGQKKIEGDLIFPSNSLDNPVIITGPIWVTGKILASNNSAIKLQDGLSYGYPIIADNPSDQASFGQIEFNNNVITQDSSEGGKLLFIATNKSSSLSNPAIWLYNNVNKDSAQSIIFSLNGLIRVQNNAKFKEITGYAIYLANNAEIVYESGLINAGFSSGPSGGWEVVSWRETQ